MGRIESMKFPHLHRSGIVNRRDDEPEVPNQAVLVRQELASTFPRVIAPGSEESRRYVRIIAAQYFPSVWQLYKRDLVTYTWNVIKHPANV